jgi:SAM-dependent MidA family methyltransferase
MGERELASLPEPDATARAYSERLIALIRQHIEAQSGGITFRKFMELALYAPGLGYYSAGSHKLGAAGDFVTAPEIAPLFAACLARAITPVLDEVHTASVLEVGAGSGQLAAGIVSALVESKVPFEHYFILELSADLRARQQQTLAQRCPASLDRVVWLDTLPSEFNGVVLANELLDAMPVNRFVYHPDGTNELYVDWRDDGFCWREGEASDAALVRRVEMIVGELHDDLLDGYTSEINFSAEHWLGSMAQRLQRGSILLIDYGFPRHEFYHPQRTTGTLMCHYRHRAHGDPFVYPGLQDITAHVDFTAMAEAGHAAGLELAGYTNQAGFLIGSGITELASEVNPLDTRAQLAVAAQLKKLTLPHEMGELFKVIGFNKDVTAVIPGFRLRDLSGAL